MTDEKATIKDLLNPENKDQHIEVELVLQITVEVLGKGKDYSATVEV